MNKIVKLEEYYKVPETLLEYSAIRIKNIKLLFEDKTKDLQNANQMIKNMEKSVSFIIIMDY